jgi:dephospho-CoA kinase
VIEADAVGRGLMQPGQPVFDAIVAQFGHGVVRSDGSLDRRALAAIAFQQGRSRELSLIVHPAVIAAQNQWMNQLFAEHPEAIAVIESALIFEAERDGTVPGWRDRFDALILVTAPKELRIARFLARSGVQPGMQSDQDALRADIEARIASQIPDEEKIPLCDFVLDNSASVEDIRKSVHKVWQQLAARNFTHNTHHERDVP